MHILSVVITLAWLGYLIQISLLSCLTYSMQQGNQEIRRNLLDIQSLCSVRNWWFQNWSCPWASSHLSAKFICHLLKITESMHICEKVTVLLQMQVIKVKMNLGTCLSVSYSNNFFVPLTFDELGF